MSRFEEIRFWIVFALSVGVSLGWILAAAHTSSHQADGGRGGAVGTAIALAFMFLTRDFGTELYSAVIRRLPAVEKQIKGLTNDRDISEAQKAEFTGPDLQTKVEAHIAAIDIDAQGQRVQNCFLALATCIGTLAWGFGDLAAKYLHQQWFR